MTHSDWVSRDEVVLWHGFTQMAAFAANAPVVVERGQGRDLIDVDGQRYLDAISSLWVTTLGHRVPELDEALIAQAGRIAHSTMLGISTPCASPSCGRPASTIPDGPTPRSAWCRHTRRAWPLS